MDNKATTKLKRRAAKVLKALVTSRGIYASSDAGWNGSFHAWFGRDTAITANLVFEAETYHARRRFSERAYKGLIRLKKWQGLKDDPTTGRQAGKIPHEVRINSSRNSQTRMRLKLFRKLWTRDPKDYLLKSWDSVDSTPLWIIGVARWHKMTRKDYSPALYDSLYSALSWCLNNLEKYDGFAGFVSYQMQPGRAGGIHNQGWKDSEDTYLDANGKQLKHPLKDVFVNACFWSALKHGSEIFAVKNPSFSARLQEVAGELKSKFNDEKGFLFKNNATGLYYFADALDAKGKQSQAICADVGMCLWAYYDNECIIDDKYMSDVVSRLMMPDMLNPVAGMRNYSRNTSPVSDDVYHRGPDTYWPFVSALIAQGLNHFGFKREARDIASSMLRGVSQFGTCIEVFVIGPVDKLTLWHHPSEKQQSALNQAWSAAAIYYASSLLRGTV